MAVISRHNEHHGDEPAWTDKLGAFPIILTLVLPLILGILVLLKCILNQCCLRKTTTKEEMFGVEGRMTMISNSETGLIGNNNSAHHTSTFTNVTNHQFATGRTDSVGSNNNTKVVVTSAPPSRSTSLDPSRLSIVSDSVDGRGGQYHASPPDSETHDLTDSLKRSTVHRQLPDLPQGHNPPRRSSSVLSHDGTSELYATVEEVPGTSGTQSASAEGSHLYSNIPEANKPSTSRTQNLKSKVSASTSKKNKSSETNPSSDSETYANSTHPYAKLKRPLVERPYARVKTRSGSAEPGGDEAEETDTDNYDVAHPYAQITARRERLERQQSAPVGNHTDESQSSTSGSANNSAHPERPTHAARAASVESEDSGGAQPVPPRRPGRQWRRSHPQGQPQPNSTNDNQVHFSGDSQDSRGYTSISVREPLSNIRNQAVPRRAYDSHYATVSDDSEEMYAAIEEPNDANYMRIPGEDGRQFQTLPNFERREANSPLPPVPPPLSPLMVSPSEISPTAALREREGLASSTPSPAPPIYAQVSKKKKTKAPITPSGSGPGTTILSSHTSATSPAEAGPSQPVLSLSASNTLPSASAASVKRRSHHHAAILDPSVGNDSDPSRRWSKADISYSEFDIIREPCFPSTSEQASTSGQKSASSGSSASAASKSKPIAHPQLDEDNYNVIPDVRSSSRVSKSSESRRVYQEDNYQEIDSTPHHPYQEIGARGAGPGSADYYQEISEIKKNKKPKHRDNMYQTIRGKNGEGDESDDEDEDQFYEKVKVKPTTSGSSVSSTHTHLLPPNPPASINPNIRKHGYEKLKRKTDETTNMTRVEIVISDEEDDDNELYEQVKYPPYERLQESRDTLLDAEGDNLYEDIGYSQLKARKGSGRKSEESGASTSAPPPLPPESPTVDVDQLYARVDKSRKKRKSDSQVQALGIEPLDQDKDHSIEYI